ncbi:hypothetical protein [Cryobacterium fucosi]|uniref:Bacterial spore germination immunoglobulin-like domain-containing protein n=1 Tax=Cryobacterium fucosi TaxID=1259157 RepID=A0A4R9BH42_9MICO|nr:hypothetical protein [Cryobacterium fucosi]TFD83764.1 hypothetical protein E3T48_00130 [Cryobacterium fucosi]
MKCMTPRAIALVALAAVLIVGGGAYALAASGAPGSSGGSISAGAAQTTFPGLAAPSGQPELESIGKARPRPGEVVQAAGPFDDRFLLENLAFDGAAVSGAVRVTSDVSAVLELEVVAGFYDDKGALLGTGRFVHHLVDDGSHSGAPEELVTFTIAVPPGIAGPAVSVALGVPVLVNE